MYFLTPEENFDVLANIWFNVDTAEFTKSRIQKQKISSYIHLWAFINNIKLVLLMKAPDAL